MATTCWISVPLILTYFPPSLPHPTQPPTAILARPGRPSRLRSTRLSCVVGHPSPARGCLLSQERGSASPGHIIRTGQDLIPAQASYSHTISHFSAVNTRPTVDTTTTTRPAPTDCSRPSILVHTCPNNCPTFAVIASPALALSFPHAPTSVRPRLRPSR